MFWKKVSLEAWARTKKGLGSGYRLITSIELPVVGFLVTYTILRHMTITIPITAIVGVMTAVGLYLLFLIGEFLLHFFRIPSEWHSAQLQIIQQNSNRITELETPPPPTLRAEILQVNDLYGSTNYDRTLSILHVSVLVEFRNRRDTNTSIHSFRLWLIDGLGEQIGSEVLPQVRQLQSQQVYKERFGFALYNVNEGRALSAARASQWKVTFKDTADNPIETKIFRYSKQ